MNTIVNDQALKTAAIVLVATTLSWGLNLITALVL